MKHYRKHGWIGMDETYAVIEAEKQRRTEAFTASMCRVCGHTRRTNHAMCPKCGSSVWMLANHEHAQLTPVAGR
jgi:uncharacterized OB-fold protein